MIRVNLLPINKTRRRTAGRTQLVMFAAIILLECIAFGAVYMTQSSRASDLKSEVAQHQAEVNKAEKSVKAAKVLETKQKQLQQQLKILTELEKKRSGPVRVLDELQALLSPPRNQEERHARSRMNWNVEWDTRRLWISALTEKEGDFEMTGSAVNADDVAEFLERLTTASHFHDVQLDYVKAAKSGQSDVNLVTFRVTGKLRYAGDSTDNGADGS